MNPGDRIATYGIIFECGPQEEIGDSTVVPVTLFGTISRVLKDGQVFVVIKDNGREMYVHRKQCRKLVVKKTGRSKKRLPRSKR